MRTTLTLEPDVEAMLADYRERHDLGLKQAINRALREGLRVVETPAGAGQPFSTRVVDHGRPLLPDLDDIGGVLEILEEKPPR